MSTGKFIPSRKLQSVSENNNWSRRPVHFEVRQKVIVVPKSKKKVVVVRNKNSKQLTFPGGGCKKGENSRTCAAKELREETRGTVSVNKANLQYLFSFPNRSRVPSHLMNNFKKQQVVTQIYDVYSVNVSHKPNKENFRLGTFLTNAEKRNNKFFETNNIRRISVNNLRRFSPGIYGVVVNNILPKL